MLGYDGIEGVGRLSGGGAPATRRLSGQCRQVLRRGRIASGPGCTRQQHRRPRVTDRPLLRSMGFVLQRVWQVRGLDGDVT